MLSSPNVWITYFMILDARNWGVWNERKTDECRQVFFCFYFFVFLASRLLPFVNVSRKTRKAKTKRHESRVGRRRKEDETIETCGHAKVCVLLKGKTPLFYFSNIFCFFKSVRKTAKVIITILHPVFFSFFYYYYFIFLFSFWPSKCWSVFYERTLLKNKKRRK
jgi:hypothetical protein